MKTSLIEIEAKVPQIIDPDKIVRLHFPGERLVSHSHSRSSVSIETEKAGARISRLYGFSGGIWPESPIIFSDKTGLYLAFGMKRTEKT